MITTLRVDDRLIHGQVALSWSKELKLTGIVVANDKVSEDEIQKMALKMAAPKGIKVAIKSVNKAIKLLNNPKAKKMRLLVLVNNLEDALKVQNNVENIPYINIGNVGRFEGQDISKKQALSKTVYVTEEDIKTLEELVKINSKVAIQVLPADKPKLIKELL